MRRSTALPALFLAAALTGALITAGAPRAEPAPFLVEDGAARYGLVPIDEVAPPIREPDLMDRAAAHAVDAWNAAKAIAREVEEVLTPLFREVRAEAESAAGEIERVSAPALAAAGVQADAVLEEAGRLTADARETAGEVAATLHAKTAELREHPVVQAASDVGILLRVVEVIGVTALVGGMAWRKLRGA